MHHRPRAPILIHQKPKADMDTQITKQPTTRRLAGVSVPDTPLIAKAIEYARANHEPYLFNHAVRSWLFAVVIAERRQSAHDPEVLALTTLLHDLGLEKAFEGSLRFEVEGANAARSFARSVGLDERRAQLVWDGVALNSTVSIALHKEAEVALSTLGIGLDWAGFGYEGMAEAEVSAILRAFPRLDMKENFKRAVCRICEARPATTYDNFARDFGERFLPRYKAHSTVDLLMNSPFTE
jgi:hypothetical protein